jgi:hypothetical protein
MEPFSAPPRGCAAYPAAHSVCACGCYGPAVRKRTAFGLTVFVLAGVLLLARRWDVGSQGTMLAVLALSAGTWLGRALEKSDQG